MNLENLQIKKTIVHEIFPRDDDKGIVAPQYSDSLEKLGTDAANVFRQRLTGALSGNSQCLQMDIVNFDDESLLAKSEALLSCTTDDDFISLSRKFADKLNQAQLTRQIPGGMVIVFEGTVGAKNRPFVGVIKAEVQQGFRRGKESMVELLDDIFLTPATRLYKIGLFLHERDDGSTKVDCWKAFVFDSNISSNNREAAAVYFYSGFLGCALPKDGAYETMKFFDDTKNFIRHLPIDGNEKKDLIDSLFVFVRDVKAPTFLPKDFGDTYLADNLRPSFEKMLRSKSFANRAIARDLSKMGTRLVRRKLKFGAEIELSASPEALKEKIIIERMDAQIENSSEKWTKVIIKEPFGGEK